MTEPVRTAHVIGALNYGGVETCALNLLRELPRSLIESRVYFTGEALTDRAQEFARAAAGFKHVPFITPHRVRFIRRLAESFRADRIEAVLCYSFGNHAWVSMAAAIARVSRCYVRVGGSPLRGAMTRLKCIVLSHLARPFCGGEIAQSYQIRQELVAGLGLPARRVCVIENFVNVFEVARRAAIGRAMRLDAAGVIIMAARMDDAKDHATMIKAFAELIREGLALRLRLAGDGPARAAHEALCRAEGVESFVEFLGARSDVPELLGASDVAVLSTHTEGFGLAMAEAMSAGVPIVATSLAVTREVLDEGFSGLLVPPRDPHSLADAIKRLLADPALRERLVSSAFEKAARRYDIGRAIQEYSLLLAGTRAHLFAGQSGSVLSRSVRVQ